MCAHVGRNWRWPVVVKGVGRVRSGIMGVRGHLVLDVENTKRKELGEREKEGERNEMVVAFSPGLSGWRLLVVSLVVSVVCENQGRG